MGLFSGFFKKIASSTSFLGSYREAGGKSFNGGGWGLDRFNSIIEAHSSVEDLVEELAIDDEDSEYASLDGYENCWEQAYDEEYEKAIIEAEELAELEIIVDPEDLIDMEVVEEKAYRYACELVQAWLDGEEWCPEDVMDYAWYELSDHNL